MTKVFRVYLLFFALASSIAAAQTSQHVLRNADVMKMAANGVPDDTILVSIANSKSAFDTSTDQLIVLSKAGVHPNVVEAMIKAGHPAPAPSTVSHADSAKKSETVQSPASSDLIGDDFAKSALRALSAILGENGKFSMLNGELNVPRRTQETIDEADASARTSREKQIVNALNGLYIVHLRNNMTREIERMKLGTYSPEMERRADEAIARDPRLLKLAHYEAACANPLEDQLRSRRSEAIPDDCAHIRDDERDAAHDPAPVVPSMREKGQVNLQAAVEALGGKSAFDAIHNYVETTTDGAEMAVSFPGQVKLTVTQGQTKQVLLFGIGKNVIMVNGQAVPLPPVVVHEGERILNLNWITIAKNLGNPAYQISSFDPPASEGTKLSGIVIVKGSDAVYWTIDDATSLPVSIRRMGLLPDGTEAEVTTMLTDWRRVNGIMVPFKSSSAGPGVPAKSRTTATFVINSPALVQ